MKKAAIILSLLLLAASALALGAYFTFLQKPSVRFLMHMAEITRPRSVATDTLAIHDRGRDITVLRFYNPRIRSDRQFMLVHGVTPEGNRHPQLILMARAMADVTGMNMLIPWIEGGVEVKDLTGSIQELSGLYETLHKHLPGRYRAMGICLAASGLMVALNRVPRDIYPEKVFLIGPFMDGKALIDFYNNNKMEIDFIVKMAISLNSDNFNEHEKDLIRRAMRATRPGPTDTTAMRQILGQKLFNSMVVMDLSNKELEGIDTRAMFGPQGPQPNCRYYIMHANNDRIIPRFEGQRLSEFLQQSGARTSFLGTEIFEHTQSSITVTGFVKEMKYLVGFFDELFEGDVGQAP
jgi:hypothetical protein